MSIGNHVKADKRRFANTSKELKKLKRTDPIRFNIIYNEWKRQQKHNYFLR